GLLPGPLGGPGCLYRVLPASGYYRCLALDPGDRHPPRLAQGGEVGDMEGHPIEGLMKTAMESIKEMVDVNTVVGDAVETQDGTVIIPVSRVSFGFAAGGGEYGGDRGGMSGRQEAAKAPFAGGSGAGVSVQPVGFLIVGHDQVRMLPVTDRAIYDRLKIGRASCRES